MKIIPSLLALTIDGGNSDPIVITPPDGIAKPPAPSLPGTTPALDFLWTIIRFSINLLLFVGIALALIFLIIGGIKLITSGGDKQASQSAQGTITNALIGMGLLIGSFIILSLVQSLTGVSIWLIKP